MAVKKNVDITWGGWIKSRLVHLEISQRELARRLGRESDTVNRWLLQPHMPLKEKDIAPLAKQLDIHPEDLPYAHLLYKPDDDGVELDPENPRLAEFVATVYMKERAGNPYPAYAEEFADHTYRSLPRVLAEAAVWFQHEISDLIDHYMSLASADLDGEARKLLEPVEGDQKLYSRFGTSHDPAASITRRARQLRETFDIPALSRVIPPSIGGVLPEDMDTDKLAARAEQLSSQAVYRLFAEAVKLRAETQIDRVSIEDFNRRAAEIRDELDELKASPDSYQIDLYSVDVLSRFLPTKETRTAAKLFNQRRHPEQFKTPDDE